MGSGSAGRRIGTTAGAAAAYAVLTVVMTWPFVNYGHFATASYGGDQRLIIWTLAWDNHAVLHWLHLFSSNVFFPARDSLRYNEHLFGVSLVTLPMAAAGISPVLAHNITWWLAFFLNGLVVFAWIRRFVDDRLAAFAGSLVFACSSYVMLHVHAHLHLVWLWPLPASALLLEHWFRQPSVPRVAAWLAVVLMGILTSWYLAAIVALVNAATGLGLVLTPPDKDAPGLWRRRVVHIACAAVLTAAVVYPFARQYVGLRINPAEAAFYAPDLASYLVPPENTLMGGWWKAHVDGRPRPLFGEQTLFAGWIAMSLGIVGLVVLVRGRTVPRMAWVCPLLLAGGFLLSLGPSPPLLGGPALAPFGWLARLPGFSGMRAPGRFGLVCMMGLSGLAAIGASTISRRLGKMGPAAVVLLVPLMLAEWFVVGFPSGKPEPEGIPSIYLTPQVRSARAIASLPEYRDRVDWFKGSDYLYYSTAHWRPIVNGFGRSEPENQATVIQAVRGFAVDPAPARALGVQYVVVHSARLEGAERRLVDTALGNPLCRLASQVGDDYLFELLDVPARARR